MTFTQEHPDFLASLSDVSSVRSDSRSSAQSRDTAPTEYAASPVWPSRKGFQSHAPPSPTPRTDPLALRRQSAHISDVSLPSTVSSLEDIPDKARDVDVTGGRPQTFWSEAVPASSADFAELFPSSRLLSVRHDDSTLDGNMNLRVDTRATTPDGQRMTITLFHLRMKDLKTRQFSLRRYCRDSGREVCHTARKPQRTALSHSKPHIRRSLSNALHGFRNRSESDTLKLSQNNMLKRSDSGYDSCDFEDDLTDSASTKQKPAEPASSDLIGISFSNYAHLELRRKGMKADKKYEFEYWGENYQWQRVTQVDDHANRSYSYHLVRRSDDQIVAHIVPIPTSPDHEREEAEMGGWVHPCSMRITDLRTLEGSPDVAEAIVATGLTTLVDDSIRRHFHPPEAKKLVIPMPMNSSITVNMDHVGPKKLIDEAFGRHGHHHIRPHGILHSSRPKSMF